MIYVTAVTTIPPEKRDEVVAAFLDWTKVARQLPGVITHGFYTDLSDENTIRFYAEYESEADWRESTKHAQHKAMSEVIKANELSIKAGGTASPLSNEA